MNITYYPFEPFKIEDHRVNILDVGNAKMYFELCQGFRDLTDVVHISDDNFALQVCSKQCSWYGDLMLSVDLNKLFLRKIQQRMLELMSDEQQVALLDQSRTVVNKVTDASFLLDLPLEIDTLPDLEKIIKFTGIGFQPSLSGDPFAILQTLIQTHVELGIDKKVVLTNVSHYISREQFITLSEITSDLGVTIVIIEFSELNRMDKFQNACYYYVDSDLVDWRNMS